MDRRKAIGEAGICRCMMDGVLACAAPGDDSVLESLAGQYEPLPPKQLHLLLPASIRTSLTRHSYSASASSRTNKSRTASALSTC